MTRWYAVALALGALLTTRAQADDAPNEPNSAADVVVLKGGGVVPGQACRRQR